MNQQVLFVYLVFQLFARQQNENLAEEAILKKFDSHKIVTIGMSHWQQNQADFVIGLVRNPKFAERVQNVVIEDGNALYQNLLDKYVAGDEIPADEVKKVYQNTTQPGRGDAPQHLALLSEVRNINRKRSAASSVRVLAGDPPIDWSKIREPKDIVPFMDRDGHFLNVVLKQVIAQNENALLIIGSGHIMRKPMSYEGFPDTTITITAAIEKKYPGSTYVVIPYEDFGARTKELEARLTDWKTPTLVEMNNSWVGDLDASLVYTGKILRIGMDPQHPAKAYSGLKLKDLADGLLYMGPIASIRRIQWEPERGTPYAHEVARRDSLMTLATMPNVPSGSTPVRVRH